MFLALVFLILFYMAVFGSKNAAIGITVMLATFMNLREDMSYKPALSFAALLVLGNIVRENIEVGDDNSRLYYLPIAVADGCNFILTYLDINGISDNLRNNLLDIIDKDNSADEHLNVKDSVIANAAAYVMKMFEKEREMI